jgi:ribosomal protein L15
VEIRKANAKNTNTQRINKIDGKARGAKNTAGRGFRKGQERSSGRRNVKETFRDMAKAKRKESCYETAVSAQSSNRIRS